MLHCVQIAPAPIYNFIYFFLIWDKGPYNCISSLMQLLETLCSKGLKHVETCPLDQVFLTSSYSQDELDS